jgi:putative transposase
VARVHARITDRRRDFLHKVTTRLVRENQAVVIDRWYPSSKTCPACGHAVERLPLSVREWDCASCGARHDRDINAAKNIRAAGLAVLACGGGVRPSRRKPGRQPPVKQEPQRVTAGIPVL